MTTSNVKKDFQAIVDFLEANENKKVSTLMNQIIEMCSSKSNQQTSKYDEAGNLVEVFCYYHKVWEKVSECEYGSKANTKTGLNTMCKEGVSSWTKQQRVAAKAKAELLQQVQDGLIQPSELEVELAKIEAQRTVIVPRTDVTAE